MAAVDGTILGQGVPTVASSAEILDKIGSNACQYCASSYQIICQRAKISQWAV
jgi:hypothetical protein